MTWILLLATYHALTLAQVATTSWTHVCVSNAPVVYVRTMQDGDVHVTLDDGRAKVVAEIIPQIPLTRPKKGQRVDVCGITRWDRRHGWPEIHPVTRLEVRR
jgi:hypothetical protein